MAKNSNNKSYMDMEKVVINLIFIEHSGEQHQISVTAGTNLMNAAVDHAIPGIDADCGGACACGTCHIKIQQEWLNHVGTASDNESSMLEMTPESNERSRLACQITLSEEMNGLVVELPEFQM